MQMTVREVSRLLGIPELTVLNWVKRRGLPARYVAGRCRFNRTELLQWTAANRVKVSVELFECGHDKHDAGFAAALQRVGSFHQLAAGSRDEALRALVHVLPLPEALDRDVLLSLFRAREADGSTALGEGIAIPHVGTPIVLNVPQPMLSLCFLQRPVDFGAPDGKPVGILFSVISPTVRGHLRLLSRLSFALHEGKFKEAVLAHAPCEAILCAARQVDAELAAYGRAAG